MLFKLIQSMRPVLVQFCVTRLLAFTTQTGKNLYNLGVCMSLCTCLYSLFANLLGAKEIQLTFM